jgi:predicted SpoU family rRNA methylase
MIQMHSRPKEQREAIRQLVHSVLTRDMGTFNPERFKEWIKDIDARFRKVGLTLHFTIRTRAVHFTIKEIRSRRTAYKFTASTHVPFEDRDVVMTVEEYGQTGR